MGQNSSIEWTDHTQNWWIGCTEVSPACDHCYARTLSERYGWAQWGNHPRHRTSPANWAKPFIWNRKARAAGKRARVFTNSLSDFGDNQVPPEWRIDAWETMRMCEWLDWLVLTKRPSNIPKMLPAGWEGRLPPNIWFGTTVENQAEADRRIPELRAIPAAVRFLSCEPLLERIVPDLTDIDWVIVGGESGHGRRHMDHAWMRALLDQCARAGVAFFGKQDDKVRVLPPDLLVRQWPQR